MISIICPFVYEAHDSIARRVSRICRATWEQDIIYHKASTTAGNSFQRGPKLHSVAHCVFKAVRWGVSSNNSGQKDWSKFWEAGWARHWTIPPRPLHLILRWEIRPSSICVHTNGRSYLGMKRPCGNYSCCIPAEGGWWQGSQCIINMCRSSPEEEACWNPHVQEKGGGMEFQWPDFLVQVILLVCPVYWSPFPHPLYLYQT